MVSKFLVFIAIIGISAATDPTPTCPSQCSCGATSYYGGGIDVHCQFADGVVPINLATSFHTSVLPTIVSLRLSESYITSLPAGIFDDFVNLRFLDLSRNQLKSLPSNLLTKLTTLQILDLSENLLTTIPSGFFDSNGMLTRLDMPTNQLATIPADAFTKLIRLQRLNLYDNVLETLPGGVFDTLTQLEYLQLTHNQLTSLPAKLFDHILNTPNKQGELLLKNNFIDIFPADIFKGVTANVRIDEFTDNCPNGTVRKYTTSSFKYCEYTAPSTPSTPPTPTTSGTTVLPTSVSSTRSTIIIRPTSEALSSITDETGEGTSHGPGGVVIGLVVAICVLVVVAGVYFVFFFLRRQVKPSALPVYQNLVEA